MKVEWDVKNDAAVKRGRKLEERTKTNKGKKGR